MEAPQRLQNVSVDVSKIRLAIQSEIPLTITTYTLPHEMEEFMGMVLTAFLQELNQMHLCEYLKYCLSELVTNSKKANTKRIYFRERQLNIYDINDYREGMRTFKDDTLNNIQHYLQLQKQAGLYVKLLLQTRNNKIKIEVRNNCELTATEYKRMHDKLNRAQQYTSVEQALTHILDDSEGAGLGLVIMILMLEKVGLTEENFQILSERGETITRIILPIDSKTQSDLSHMSQELVKVIESLPLFPENITRINTMLNDPDVKLSEVAALISSDVSLTTSLLKLVNSSLFALTDPCRNITSAVKLAGLRGIKNMLLSIGSVDNLMSIVTKDSKLPAHAARTAFYAYNLARNFCADDKLVLEDAYVCGLLHDMGKFIFESVWPELLSHAKRIYTAKGISTPIFEQLSAGVNHGELGALLAEKWNFPKTIIDVIHYHHDPYLAPEGARKITSIVYLADFITHYETHDIAYYKCDEDVLALFNITDEAQLQQIAKQLAAAFAKTGG